MEKNVKKTTEINLVFTKILNLDKSLEKKWISKKHFELNLLRLMSFLMIPLTFFYDEYINPPKLTEEKKRLSI